MERIVREFNGMSGWRSIVYNDGSLRVVRGELTDIQLDDNDRVLITADFRIDDLNETLTMFIESIDNEEENMNNDET